MTETLKVGILLFDIWETLDVMGPVEMFGMHPDHFDIHFVAEKAGPIASGHGPLSVAEHGFDDCVFYDIILIPGGFGTRREIENKRLLDWIAAQAAQAKFVTSVCTGSALLAKAGVLTGRRATSNKMNFAWVTSQGPETNWVEEARWVEDGNIFTSSGVSAGVDMTLALISRILGEKAAEDAALWSEYDWHRDPDWDPFAKKHGLV